jgi:hypothetical protein
MRIMQNTHVRTVDKMQITLDIKAGDTCSNHSA